MEYDVFGIALTILCFFVAAVVQGAAGFGFGLVALGLLSTLMTFKTAAVLPVIAVLAVNVTIFVRLRKHFRLDRMVPLTVAALAGVPLGVWFLDQADATIMRFSIGALLIVSAAYSLAPKLAARRWHPYWLGVPCGLLSGGLSGAFGTGGPPLVAYTITQGFERFRYSASLQFVFMVGTLVRLACLIAGGLVTRHDLAISAFGATAAVGGVLLGLKVLRRLADQAIRMVAAVMLLLLGLKYLLIG